MKIRTRPVILMHSERRLHRRVSLAASAPYTFRTASSWAALQEVIRDSPPSALAVVDPFATGSWPGSGGDPLEGLVADFPSLPVLVALPLNEANPALLRRLGDLGLAGVIVVGHDDTPTALRAHFDAAHAAPLKRRLAAVLPPGLSVQAHALLAACAELAADAGLARDVAARFGASRRTLVRMAERAALPAPRRLMVWMRVLLAASLLDECSRSGAEVARGCGFASDSGLRRVVGKYTGMSPKELRRRGAFRTAANRFVADLDRYAARAARSEGSRDVPRRPTTGTARRRLMVAGG
jgi:AraC-like DNA-binding protein